MRICLGGMVALLTAAAWGQEASPSPAPNDVAASHKYYNLGAEAYEKGDFGAALRAFEAAWAEAPNPELQFNIARCHERMFQWEAAAESYQTYLDTKQNAPDAYELKQRIAELRRRAYETQHPTPATPAAPAHDVARGLRTGAGVTLAATLVLAGAGAGAYFSAWNELDDRRASCQSRCAPETLDGLRTRVEIAADLRRGAVRARRRSPGHRRRALGARRQGEAPLMRGLVLLLCASGCYDVDPLSAKFEDTPPDSATSPDSRDLRFGHLRSDRPSRQAGPVEAGRHPGGGAAARPRRR